jgi:ribosomally synthesized peptide (two-chain TOMM family)
MPRDRRLPTQEQMLEFSEVYLQAIAQSWENEAFRQALLADPEAALQKYFGYICPWGVKISVKPVPASHKGWHQNGQGQWRWDLPNNAIKVGVPKAPPLEEQTVALAAYNAAGPTYLFSCC